MMATLVRRTGLSVDELLVDAVVCEALWDGVLEEIRAEQKIASATRRGSLLERLRGAVRR